MIISALLDNISLAYLLIVCNFFGNLMGCDLQRLLTNNMLAKHIAGLIAFFFLITLLNKPEDGKKNLVYLWGMTFATYALFFLSTRMKLFFNIALISLLLIYSQISVSQDEVPKDQVDKVAKYERAKTVLKYLFIITFVIGVGHYIFYQRHTQAKAFDWKTFVLGTTKCQKLR